MSVEYRADISTIIVWSPDNARIIPFPARNRYPACNAFYKVLKHGAAGSSTYLWRTKAQMLNSSLEKNRDTIIFLLTAVPAAQMIGCRIKLGEVGMAAALEPNKSKIAKRVIEILEFFGENGEKATVMDIVRRYGRPQSSTSELLSSLVEMGLLYKDSRSRSYSPTPRVAALGASAQPEIIRDGSLFSLMDRLAEDTGSSVALFGMVGTYVQVFRLAHGSDPTIRGVRYGASEKLSASTAGLLLLATVAPEQVGRILWRLNAEASAETKFNPSEIREHIAVFRRKGSAVGRAGFTPGIQVTATLLPRSGIEPPLALGLLYPASKAVDADALITTMNCGVARCCDRREIDYQISPEAFRIAV